MAKPKQKSFEEIMATRATRYYTTTRELPYDPTTEAKLSPRSTPGTSKVNRLGTNVSNPVARVIGDQEVLLAISSTDKKYRAALRNLMKNRASEMQTALQTAALAAYQRAGTGRFARGIKVKGQTTEQRGFLEGKISISVPQYRETRFLTNLGGNTAYFQTFPVGPYFITAKGVEPGGNQFSDLYTELRSSGLGKVWDPKQRKSVDRQFTGANGQRMIRDPVTGHTGVARRTLFNFTKKKGLPRLKVPREGFGSLGARGGTGRGKNAERLGPRLGGNIIDQEIDDVDQNELFYYPTWVVHPGFERDVVTETAQMLLNETINQWKTYTLEYQRDLTEKGGKTLRVRVPGGQVKNSSPEEREARQWTELTTRAARAAWWSQHPSARHATLPASSRSDPISSVRDWNNRFGRRYGYNMKP